MLFKPLCTAALALAISPYQTYAAPDLSLEKRSAPLNTSASTNSSSQPCFTFDELYNLQKKFLDSFLSPADQTQAKSINSSLLSEDCLGRIDITRTFKGRELNTEYLFGLFANLAATPGSLSLLGVPVSYEILHFAANENVVSALTRFMFNFTAINKIVPVEIDSWNTYNAQGQISQYDATFKWWQWTVDYIIGEAMPQLNASTPSAAVAKLTAGLAKSICTTAQTYCTGTDQQYQSAGECYDYLSTKVRFGASYELGRNTLLCRSVHQNMVPFRPSVHCPHIGKTGGGYCTDDTTYTETVMQDYFTNAPYIPYGYKG